MLKQLPPNCNKTICRKIQMGFTELEVIWRVLRKICHYLLILKYKKISGTSHNRLLRSKMSCHIVFPSGNTFLFKFRLDKFRSRNLLRHVKHEDHFWFSLHGWSHWGRKTSQENNCHTSCHILKALLWTIPHCLLKLLHPEITYNQYIILQQVGSQIICLTFFCKT